MRRQAFVYRKQIQRTKNFLSLNLQRKHNRAKSDNKKKTEIKTTHKRSHNKDAHLKQGFATKNSAKTKEIRRPREKKQTQGDERKEEGEINK
jgi:hypothetical protein